MSAFSHKRKFVMFDRRRFVIANSRPIPVLALTKIVSKSVSSASYNHNLIQRTMQVREFKRHPILVFRGRLAAEASIAHCVTGASDCLVAAGRQSRR